MERTSSSSPRRGGIRFHFIGVDRLYWQHHNSEKLGAGAKCSSDIAQVEARLGYRKHVPPKKKRFQNTGYPHVQPPLMMPPPIMAPPPMVMPQQVIMAPPQVIYAPPPMVYGAPNVGLLLFCQHNCTSIDPWVSKMSSCLDSYFLILSGITSEDTR